MFNPIIFKEIISDFHGRPFPEFTPRSMVYEIVPSKILTLTGVRRSGKTSFLFQIMTSLIKTGVSKQNFLLMNFEDERLEPLKVQDLGKMLESYYELYPVKKQERIYIFLDEIHNVPQWEKFVRRIHDTENAQIFLTGSSAKLLSLEIATSLRGRSINYEVFPFSFHEFVEHRKLDTTSSSSTAQAFLKHAFQDYLERGGFPEVLGCSEMVWRKILQEYLNMILYKDIIERHHIKNHPLMKYFIKHCLRNISSPLSIHKLFRDIQSQGYRVAKDTLHQYLGYVEDAYIFFTIPIFSESLRVQQVNYRKLYSVDIGLTQATITTSSEKRGQLLENLVFLELRRNDANEIYYYKTESNQEIDFLVTRKGEVCMLIQVTDHLEDPQTRMREVEALKKAMAEIKHSTATIVTREGEEEIKVHEGVISVIPFWKWSISER